MLSENKLFLDLTGIAMSSPQWSIRDKLRRRGLQEQMERDQQTDVCMACRESVSMSEFDLRERRKRSGRRTCQVLLLHVYDVAPTAAWLAPQPPHNVVDKQTVAARVCMRGVTTDFHTLQPRAYRRTIACLPVLFVLCALTDCSRPAALRSSSPGHIRSNTS